MADRTPDGDVLGQDIPRAESSDTEHGPDREPADKADGPPSPRRVAKAERSEESADINAPEQRDEIDVPTRVLTGLKNAAADPATLEDEAADADDGTGKAARPDDGRPRTSWGKTLTLRTQPPAAAPPEAEADDTTADQDEKDANSEPPAQARDAASAKAAAAVPTAVTSPESTRAEESRTREDAAAVPAEATQVLRVAVFPGAEQPAAPAASQVDDVRPAAAPLDMLAQHTDTPPPPPAPGRTPLRGVKIWAPLVALLALALVVVQLLRPLPAPTIVADSSSFTVGEGTFSMPWPAEGQAAAMVVGSGTIGTFGEQKPVPTASVAKIMTAYVVLRDHPIKRNEPGPRITIDARTVEEGKAKDESRIEGLRAGQTFGLQDMLRMLMIPSGNNVARMLARWNTGTEDTSAFVRKMNEAARSLGMKNTTYTDPSGLDKGTVSTAVDQLKLAEAVMKYESFRAVVALPSADIPGVGRIYNNNQLLTGGLSVRGIKTGSNTPAGGTLSWAAYKTVDGEDRLILGTMMDQHAPGPDLNGGDSLVLVQDNTKKVIKAVRDALTSATAVRAGGVVGFVDDGLGGRAPVVATRDLKVAGVPGQKLKLTLRGTGGDLGARTKAGDVVGELVVGSGTQARSVPVALRSDRPQPSFWTKLTRLG
ncbi:D-alanyl-D-alanine carboxypeptidase family protein [Streptomyces laurentii]|uniref:D-alanyl-D-alanine carboxypeptidase family protein n=1 Tax=Streptomyces laurentii TaxID=39478 RepID=UPI0036AAD3BD